MKCSRILLVVPFVVLTACSLMKPPPTAAPVEPTGIARAMPATSTAFPTATQTPSLPTATPTATQIPPSPTASPTATPIPPTPTATLSPTATQIPTPIATPNLAALPGAAWNFELVGHDALGSIGWYAGLALKDTCAYVGTYGMPAVTIVDIADPAHPSQLGRLPLESGAQPVNVRVMYFAHGIVDPPGSGPQPVELRTLPDLNLLVVADLKLDRLLTFDITDCAHPEPLGSIDLPEQPHEFFLWRDGDRVLAYAATFGYAPPSLVAVDLTDPRSPREVGRWSAEDEGAAGILHSLSVSLDGSTVYLALWHGGFLVAEVDLPHIAVVRDQDGEFVAAILPNTHSAVSMQDPRFVLLASEVFRCPFDGLAIVDIVDPAHPQIISHFTLPENRCDNLPPGGGTFTPHNPLVIGDLAFVSWYAAGVQALDLSDPYAPKRVGQFVPTGDGAGAVSLLGEYPVQMISYPILRDGLFYVVDSQSGLYVLRYVGPGSDKLADVPLAEGNVTVRHDE